MSTPQPSSRVRRTCPNSTKRRRIKRNLAKRDGQSCFYCARPFGDLAEATLDHLVPYSIWPTWQQANLVLACPPCNQAKGHQLPQKFLKSSTLFRPTGGATVTPLFGDGADATASATPKSA